MSSLSGADGRRVGKDLLRGYMQDESNQPVDKLSATSPRPSPPTIVGEREPERLVLGRH